MLEIRECDETPGALLPRRLELPGVGLGFMAYFFFAQVLARTRVTMTTMRMRVDQMK